MKEKVVLQINGYFNYGLSLRCVKGVRIRSYSGPYFPAFGLNTERYSVSLRIQSECGKIRTRITPNTETFHAVLIAIQFVFSHSFRGKEIRENVEAEDMRNL